jgi:hypothetical protein
MDTMKKFQDLLEKLFQFEAADLDFGVHRIFNSKKDRLEKFIREDLKKRVKAAFAKHKEERLADIEQRFNEVTQKVIQGLGAQAFTLAGELSSRLEAYPIKEEFKDTPLGREYLIDDVTLKGFLTKEYKNEKPLLLYQLLRFTAKNTKDYFIHQNLKRFLSEQLDYFTKAEVLSLETLEKEKFLAKHLTRAKVVREIGEDTIDFLAQVVEKGRAISRARIILGQEILPREGRRYPSQKTINELERQNRIRLASSGNPQMLKPSEIYLTDNWSDIYGYSSNWDFQTENIAETVSLKSQQYKQAELGVTGNLGEVLVLEMTKLVEEKRGGGVTLPVEVFEGRNLIFVDEGHKGRKSEEQKWDRLRDKLAKNRFVFE